MRAVPKRKQGWAHGGFSALTGPEQFPDLEGDTFMTLYPIVRTPWVALVVRKIEKPNVEDHLHTHGLPYLTWIIKGGYVELRKGGIRTHRRFHFNWIPRDEAHRIVRVFGTTWTIGLHLKWLQNGPYGMLVDGKLVPIWDYVTSMRENRAGA
jgi:hypothetical protein